MGYVCKVGAECEFYLFSTNEDGDPTDMPFDKGGYLDMYPLIGVVIYAGKFA